MNIDLPVIPYVIKEKIEKNSTVRLDMRKEPTLPRPAKKHKFT